MSAAPAACPELPVKGRRRRWKDGSEILTAVVELVDFGYVQVAQPLPLSNRH